MSILKKNNGSISEERERENMVAAVAKQEALIEYIAIMTDCEEILESENEESEADTYE